jgi:hypothetical protein
LPVATIASSVTIGCSIHTSRRRWVSSAMPTATISAQPKCSDGIAANWFATEPLVSFG